MKINMPVTSNEIIFDDAMIIMTRTDLKGIITYANQDFIKLSGFSEAELVGSSHNIVRHPDMPVEAFKDLWRNLKAGRPWAGLVKNRTKTGDFYWVEANVAPIVEGGTVAGYESVRRKPARSQVEAAGDAYRLFKEGKAKGLMISDGKVVKNSILNKLKIKVNAMKVSQRLAGMIGFAVLVVVMQAGLGLYQLITANNSLKTVYEDRMLPVADLGKISNLMLENRTYLRIALSEVAINSTGKEATLVMNPEMAAKSADAIENNIEVISELWKGYMATYLTPEEKILADKFAASRGKFVKEALKPAVATLRANDYEATKTLSGKARELYTAAGPDLAALLKLQGDVAKQEYQTAVTNYEKIRGLTFAGLAVAIVILIWLGFALVHFIGRALGGEPREINSAATRMAAGDLSFTISLAANDNTSAMSAMSALQGKVKLLVTDAVMLADAAKKGLLSTRANANQHQGDFRKVVEGVNNTLDDVIGPLNVAANYVDRISKGDIPAKIADTYNGDFNTIKNNLNACIDAVNNMVAEANALEKAAIEGRLATRADASKYQGDFRKVVIGVNNCLDAVIGPLNVAAGYVDNFAKGSIPARITDSYNGDFNIIKNNLNSCVDALNLLVDDANMLAQAAQDNKLDTRADASKHLGDYRKVVEGVNGTLDTVMDKNATDAAEKAAEARVLEAAVEETQSIIEGAKNGDLTSRVSLEGKVGAIASLCEGVNALMSQMTEVIVQVRESGETINTAAGEISQGNNDLSQRTEQQASSLEETAASMEELASTVKQNADNAKQANVLAATASSVAVKGGEVVAEVVSTMSAINDSAKKIEDIISVIDGIAFQTNILALNAAVEAARAGEQGRGFAVVAGEVRNLAQRSASAAKEIKDLITDSVTKTAEGTKQVENAGHTMEEVVISVKRVADIISEIAAASIEQSEGINQVNTAVTSMDEVTQQNAALVEQAAAASESLVEQANALMDSISVFKVSSGRALIPAKGSNVKRSAPRLVSPKSMAKIASARTSRGTNDGDWEEF